MTRIRRVTILEYRRRFDRPAWNPAWRWVERRAPLVIVEDDDGVAGLGEAWAEQDRIGDLHRHLAGLAPGLIGRPTADMEAIWADLSARPGEPAWVAPAAASAIDQALRDLDARRAGVPLWRRLGGGRDRVPAYASGGLYAEDKDAAALAGELQGYVEAGFRAVKMKAGALAPEADRERVRAAKAAIGGAALYVDLLSRLDAARAPGWLALLADEGVAAVQAPVPLDDVATLARLVRAGRLAVLAGEAAWRPEVFARLLDAGAVTWLQLNPGLVGLTGYLRLARAARAAGVPTTPQVHGTAVLQAVALHLGARDEVVTVEAHRFHRHMEEVSPVAVGRPGAGAIALGPGPGLGIVPRAVAAHPWVRAVLRVPDPAARPGAGARGSRRTGRIRGPVPR